MTPRQRRKRRIVAHILWQDRLHKTLQQITAANRRFSVAMANVYAAVRADPAWEQTMRSEYEQGRNASDDASALRP